MYTLAKILNFLMAGLFYNFRYSSTINGQLLCSILSSRFGDRHVDSTVSGNSHGHRRSMEHLYK